MKADTTIIFEHAGWPVFAIDDSGMVQQANAAAVSVLGTVMNGRPSLGASIWDPENDLTIDEVLSRVGRSSDPRSRLKFRVKGGRAEWFDTVICRYAGEGQQLFLFQLYASKASSAPAQVPSGKEGASGAQSAETVQRQKLECALQLTRTVSLDFNNALTTILGHSSLILSRLEADNVWRRSLVEIEKSAERAAEIAQDLADFSRQEKDVKTQAPGNLNRLIRHAVEAFQQPSVRNVLWTLNLEKRLYSAVFDEAKMQQAFARILENSIEALGSDGQISVRTMNHSFEQPVISPSVHLAPGHYVCVEFADNGGGIPTDLLTRVFEPFFSTKGDSHRGLGLAWVYGIVTNHGGVVSVVSPPGQGTTVRIFLPAQQKIVRDQATKVDDLRGTETVLLVDDEEMLLNLGQTVLTAFGYKVLTANGGVRGLELFSQGSAQIDLVITDLVMPGMSGRELVDQLRRIEPKMPILCTSGYLRIGSGAEEENYLRKPFTSQELLRKVRQVLQASDVS